MLVNAKELLNKAKEGKYAIPQFNINNLEWTRYVLETCEEMKSPVILGVSEGANKYMGGFHTVYNVVQGLMFDLNITIPVVLHLDHGSSIDACKKAIDNGFTSVMLDGSTYPIDQNIAMTKEVVEYAKKKDVSVEGEVGLVGGEEDGIVAEVNYAKTKDCVKMVQESGIDYLAASLGSVHGLYKGEAKLAFDRMKEISEATNYPLVLHGGTGIHDENIKKAISCGITKINVNTELQISWSNAVRKFLENDKEVYDPRKIIKAGEQAMKESIRQRILVFGSNNRHQ